MRQDDHDEWIKICIWLIALWVLILLAPSCATIPPQAAPAAPPTIAIPVEPAQPATVINRTGLELTEYYEGLYLKAYKDSVGVWTICFGRIDYPDGRKVASTDTATVKECEAYLLADLEEEGAHYVRAWAPKTLNSDQFSALVSFTYNRGSSRLRALLDLSADPAKIADNLLKFDYAGTADNHLLGLKRRRRSERALFLSQDWTAFKGWTQ